MIRATLTNGQGVLSGRASACVSSAGGSGIRSVCVLRPDPPQAEQSTHFERPRESVRVQPPLPPQFAQLFGIELPSFLGQRTGCASTGARFGELETRQAIGPKYGFVMTVANVRGHLVS
jgi:hypothetical protein